MREEGTERQEAKRSALVLAGAVAKGAFEAGVLSVLADRAADLNIVRVVGASAGALNGAVYAAGIRAGREQEAARCLQHLWADRAGWRDVFRFRVDDIVHLRGGGTAGNVLDLLQNAVRGWSFERQKPVDLRLLLTNLSGQMGRIGTNEATTYEHVARFQDRDFDDEDGWARICRTAVGSAAFPMVYSPVDVSGVGPCLDGGIVNNTPVKWAAEGGIDRIIVVSPQAAVLPAPSAFQGLELLGKFVDILINERLYRDLREALSVNRRLAELDELVASADLGPETAEAVKRRFGWRPLEIIQVRPHQPLDGTSFSGFGDQEQRVRYIESGRDRAAEVLAGILPAT